MSPEDTDSETFSETQYVIFQDPCHGSISLRQDSICCKFIHTPQFGRLRGIHQLGGTRFVFSGATHSRFAHSLGVCHLAGCVVDHLNILQKMKISEEEKETVMLAGLLHDIGHGPFSHLFDSEILPALKNGEKGNHELRGLAVIDFCKEDNEIDIPPDMLKNVKDMIVGKRPKKGDPHFHRGFLWDIVNNSESGIDVDKMDYLVRDAYYCGTPTKLDPMSIIANMRVVKRNICFEQSADHRVKKADDSLHPSTSAGRAIYGLFHTRWEQHVEIYQHPDVKAVEFMIKDIMIIAESASDTVDLSKAFSSTEEFCKQKDSILDVICSNPDPALDEAKALYGRLEAGDLYQLVASIRLPENEWHREVTHEIWQHLPGRANVSMDDVMIHNMEVNYGAKDKDPVEKVFFCKKGDMSQRFRISRESVSAMLPSKFEDRMVRVFYRFSDSPMQVEALKVAAETFRASLLPGAKCNGVEEKSRARKRTRNEGSQEGEEVKAEPAQTQAETGVEEKEEETEEEGEEFEVYPSQVEQEGVREKEEAGGGGDGIEGGEERAQEGASEEDDEDEDFEVYPSQVEQ